MIKGRSMAVIDDRAMASWRDWVQEQDKKKEVEKKIEKNK